jgi:hypothetical protein
MTAIAALTVPVSARCEARLHLGCRGWVVSLAATTACRCPCHEHASEVRAAA